MSSDFVIDRMDIPILEFFRISFNLCGSQDVRCHKNSVLTGDGRKNTIKFDVPSFYMCKSDKPQCLVNYFGEATSFKWREWLDFRWVEFFNNSCQCPIHDYWVSPSVDTRIKKHTLDGCSPQMTHFFQRYRQFFLVIIQ